mmetsp:Transcript_60776/g.185585  ORF Transcript_60776/g.185585 Transcript_60776/m.185585 type:complete len:425 (-) Transcript_60776:53-1327(-)
MSFTLLTSEKENTGGNDTASSSFTVTEAITWAPGPLFDEMNKNTVQITSSGSAIRTGSVKAGCCANAKSAQRSWRTCAGCSAAAPPGVLRGDDDDAPPARVLPCASLGLGVSAVLVLACEAEALGAAIIPMKTWPKIRSTSAPKADTMAATSVALDTGMLAYAGPGSGQEPEAIIVFCNFSLSASRSVTDSAWSPKVWTSSQYWPKRLLETFVSMPSTSISRPGASSGGDTVGCTSASLRPAAVISGETSGCERHPANKQPGLASWSTASPFKPVPLSAMSAEAVACKPRTEMLTSKSSIKVVPCSGDEGSGVTTRPSDATPSRRPTPARNVSSCARATKSSSDTLFKWPNSRDRTVMVKWPRCGMSTCWVIGKIPRPSREILPSGPKYLVASASTPYGEDALPRTLRSSTSTSLTAGFAAKST